MFQTGRTPVPTQNTVTPGHLYYLSRKRRGAPPATERVNRATRALEGARDNELEGETVLHVHSHLDLPPQEANC